MLGALNEHMTSLVERIADALEREVHLRDAPDTELRRKTVGDLLVEELEHAKEHTAQIGEIRRAFQV